MSSGSPDYRWLNRDLMLEVRKSEYETEVLFAPIATSECNKIDSLVYIHKGYVDYWVRNQLIECTRNTISGNSASKQVYLDRLVLVLSLCIYEELIGIDC